jgi:hypothetical protein
MPITLHRTLLVAAGAAALLGVSAPAQAQSDRDRLLDALLDCAKISGLEDRVACYDGNIHNAGPAIAAAVPAIGAAPAGPVLARSAPGAPAPRQDARPQQGAAAPAGPAGDVQATVASVVERAPGIYLVSLADGAVWEFQDAVPLSYAPPSRGATVEIKRGALGGYQLRFDRQQPVRVRRVR